MSHTLNNLIFGFDLPLCAIRSGTIAPGKPHRLAGPNGLGKTTALLTLYGAMSPLHGEIPASWHQAAKCFVPAKAALPQCDRVQSCLKTFAHMEGARLDHVEGTADNLGLTALFDEPPLQLSTGQQKRLALTRALASKADILLLDEPFAGLDRRFAAQIEEALVALSHHKILLYVAHDRELPGSQQMALTPAQHPILDRGALN